MKKLFIVISVFSLLLTFAACKKKEEQPVAQSPVAKGPIIDTPAAPPGHGAQGEKAQLSVVVPDDVKSLWTGVTIVVEDKKDNSQKEFTVEIGGEFLIPDSNLKVKVGPFLPDFKMSASVITSASNEPNNPSVGIAIFQDDQKVFPPSGEYGWLYAKFPTIHSFQHERYSLLLKAGIKKE